MHFFFFISIIDQCEFYAGIKKYVISVVFEYVKCKKLNIFFIFKMIFRNLNKYNSHWIDQAYRAP